MSRMHVAVGLALLFLIPVAAGGNARSDEVRRVVFDEQGRILEEHGDAGAGVAFARHYWYAEDAAKPPGTPGKGGGNGGNGGDGSDPGTDCGADQYQTTGWTWRVRYSGYVSAYAAEFNAAAETWDAATSADIFGSYQLGAPGVAGELDGVNQVDFGPVGSSSTIAVTTTWYYRGSGEAVESDARYNTLYAWGTTGAAGEMDVQNIAAHEVGHTFGLDHPKGPSHKIGCLTMYAYGATGETQKQSLGDGDILGIQALYGA